MRNTWECEHAASRSTHRDILMPGDGGPTVELKGATRNSGSHAIAKHTNKMNPIHQVVTCLKAPTTVQWPDQAENIYVGGKGVEHMLYDCVDQERKESLNNQYNNNQHTI